MQHSNSLGVPNEHRDLFIDAVLAGMGVSSALFLVNITDLLMMDNYNATALGRAWNVTTGASIYHLKRLQLKNYVERVGHRQWAIGDKTLEIERGFNKPTFIQ